jgi:hypothetical protein
MEFVSPAVPPQGSQSRHDSIWVLVGNFFQLLLTDEGDEALYDVNNAANGYRIHYCTPAIDDENQYSVDVRCIYMSLQQCEKTTDNCHGTHELNTCIYRSVCVTRVVGHHPRLDR